MSSDILRLIQNFNEVILRPVFYLLAALASLLFIYGLVEFIAKADSDTERALGKQHMIWGIVGLFIMVSAIPIINIALNTFGIPEVPLNTLSN